mmetsp:Transcript_30535/g.42725  ORF Transcript_30535/g.42725 Transcript_30535/m.42725 type:complete len:204 (-) Transcript_30535:105-716(-)
MPGGLHPLLLPQESAIDVTFRRGQEDVGLTAGALVEGCLHSHLRVVTTAGILCKSLQFVFQQLTRAFQLLQAKVNPCWRSLLWGLCALDREQKSVPSYHGAHLLVQQGFCLLQQVFGPFKHFSGLRCSAFEDHHPCLHRSWQTQLHRLALLLTLDLQSFLLLLCPSLVRISCIFLQRRLRVRFFLHEIWHRDLDFVHRSRQAT